jgi:hypothetical protein
MAEGREPDGQRSESHEVKGVALNLKHSPENRRISGVGRSYRVGRRPCGRYAKDEYQPSPRGLRQHRVTQRQASNQASDEQGLLGQSAMQTPSMDGNLTGAVAKRPRRE